MTTGYFTYNAVDLGATQGLILEHRRLALIPSTRERASYLPGRPGQHDFGTDLGERVIQLDCFVNQSTRANLVAALSNIAAAFDPTNEVSGDRGFKQLIFDDLSDRYFLAKLAEPPLEQLATTTATLALQLRCADPFAYSTTLSTLTTGSGVTTNSPVVGGTYKTPLIFELTASGSYSGNVVVTNATSTEAITWNGSLVNTDVLKFDSTTFRVYKNGVVSMSGLVSGSVFPSLLAAQTNTINVTGITGGSITQLKSTWRNRWI